MDLDYEMKYLPRSIHQKQVALSRLRQPDRDDEEEVKDDIPAYTDL